MSLVNSQRDLLATIANLEARLLKVERQLAVPRTAFSEVTMAQSTGSTGATSLATEDTVSVVTTASCLVHIYFQVTIANTSTASNQVYLRDDTAAVEYKLVDYTGKGPETYAAGPLSVAGGSLVAQYSTPVTLAVTTAGPRTYKLRYATASGTATFSNRRLYAWVQPF